jgi:hypothetical protein
LLRRACHIRRNDLRRDVANEWKGKHRLLGGECNSSGLLESALIAAIIRFCHGKSTARPMTSIRQRDYSLVIRWNRTAAR